MHKTILSIASIFAALSVAFGAFGAHALEGLLTEKYQRTFETAVRYQMYHSLGLFICGVLYYLQPNKLFNAASKLFVAGILLFSGSLYLLVVFQLKHINNLNFFGAITPFGGISFITGWICLALGIQKK